MDKLKKVSDWIELESRNIVSDVISAVQCTVVGNNRALSSLLPSSHFMIFHVEVDKDTKGEDIFIYDEEDELVDQDSNNKYLICRHSDPIYKLSFCVAFKDELVDEEKFEDEIVENLVESIKDKFLYHLFDAALVKVKRVNSICVN